MKNKLLLLIIIVLISTPGVLSISITPQEIDVELFTTHSENLFFNVTNDEDVNLYHVKLISENNDISFINNDFELYPGETIEVKAVVDTSTSYESAENIKVIHYKQEDVVLQPEDKTVEITDHNYNPSEIEIVKGSKITWTNNDVLKHTVTCSLFDNDIIAGESYEYTFTEAGVVDYYDKHTNYQGKVYVKDVLDNGMVHDPKEVIYTKININSLLVETEIEISFIDGNNFTVNHGGKKESVISIHNKGTKVAMNVDLSSMPAWISFGKTSFNLDSDETTYVPFTIKPLLSNSNDTDKTHYIDLIIKGNNFETITNEVSVFVPYKEDINVNDTVENYFDGSIDLNLMNAIHVLFCQANPEHEYCVPKVIEKLVEVTPDIYLNMSAKDVYNSVRKTAENQQYVERAFKTISSDMDEMKNMTGMAKDNAVETNAKTQQLYEKTLENEDSINQIQGVLIAIMILVFVGGLGYLGYSLFMKKYMKDKEFLS